MHFYRGRIFQTQSPRPTLTASEIMTRPYEEKNLFERVTDRQTYVEKIRAPWEVDCDNIIDRFRPDLERFKDMGVGAKKKGMLGSKIYEGTGPWAARLMADGIQGNLVSQSIEWIRYSMAELFFKGNDEVNKWLQNLEEHMLSVYGPNQSNFYAALGTFCRGGVTVGSPVILPELDDVTGMIMCIVPHMVERYFMQNRFGETDVLHLKREWTIRNAVQTFGLDNFSDGVKEKYKNGTDDNVTIIRGIYFYLDRIFDKLPDETLIVKDGDNETTRKVSGFKPHSPWVSVYIEKDAQDDKIELKRPLQIKPYWSKPFAVWHYEKDITEVYSRTPAWYAYWDVNSINAMEKSLIMAGQREVEPAMWVPDFLKGKYKNYPRAINWYSTAQKDSVPAPMQSGIKMPYGYEAKADKQTSVERHFYVRMWLMLNALVEEGQAPPTATQIIQMSGEKALLIGPRVGRFTGALGNVDSRFIDIENRRGRLPEPPDIIKEYSSGEVTPEFVGPLSQLQKQFLSIRRTQVALESIDYVVEKIDPMVRHKIKAEVLVEHLLEENKFFQDAIRSDDEYKEIVAAIAQKEQEQEAMQLGVEMAKAVPSVSKDVEPNSPLAALTGATA